MTAPGRLRNQPNPTPAQVAGAQASLKRAQAVLLAAKVNEKVTTIDPIIPPPSLHETDEINSFMQSQHFSLSATTKISVPNQDEDLDALRVLMELSSTLLMLVVLASVP